MTGIKLVAKLIKALRSNASPGQIAWGFALGMIIGLTPLWSLHNAFLVVIILIFNVNLAMSIFAFLLFSLFAWALDPYFHQLGYYLLVDVEALRDFYIAMYNAPVIGLSRFNNTVVMGSLFTAILALIPVVPFLSRFVLFYREKIDPKITKLKIVQLIKGSKLYGLYEKFSGPEV
jgi:uncharacterized protein (TIGR03546 family)